MLRKIFNLSLIFLSLSLTAQSIDSFRKEAAGNYRDQNYLRAIENYKEALIINSSDLESNIGLSNSFYMIGEYEESLFYIDSSLELDEMDLELRNLKARTLLALGNYDESRILYNSVLEKEPFNINAQSGIAELRIVTGDLEGSLKDFEDIIKFSPRSRRLLLSLVVLNDKKGNFNKSDNLIQSAIKIYPTDPVVLKSAVVHYMKTGNYNGAKVYIDELLKVSEDPENLILHSELLILTKKYDQAIVTLSEYLKMVKDNHYPYYLTAVALEKQGDKLRALSLINRGLKLTPDNEIYRLYSEKLSREVYEADRVEKREYSNWYLKRGIYLEENFYYNKAAMYYLRGIDLDPLNWDLRLRYSSALNKLGYKNSYLDELEVLTRLPGENSLEDITETLEIEKSLPVNEIYSSWNPDSLKNIYKNRILFSTREDKNPMYVLSETIISDSFERFLSDSRRYTIENSIVGNHSFSDVFKEARDKGTDYFIITTYKQAKRSFTLKATIYLTESGRAYKELSYLKIGNDRVLNAIDSFKRDLENTLPKIGTILEIRGDELLIDLGLLDKLAVDNSTLVVKSDGFKLTSEDNGIKVLDEYYLGTLKLNDVDEAHSVGTFTSSNEFNLINPRDHVIILNTDTDYAPVQENIIIDYEVIEQLLRIN